MMKFTTSRMIAGVLAGSAMIASAPAAACRGPQFESALVLFSDAAAEEVPEGSIQIKVRLAKHSLRGVHDRTLIMAYVVPENGEKVGKYTKATGSVAIVKPRGTSCDHARIPKPGEYYMTGRFAIADGGTRVKINGADLFYPDVDRVKAYPF